MVDFKKIKTNTEAVTRNLNDFDKETDNIYESVAILAKRANQISTEIKDELLRKIEEFQTPMSENLEEVFENREQIELAKFYEQLPKPTLIAIYEFLNDRLNYAYPEKKEEEVLIVHADDQKERKSEEDAEAAIKASATDPEPESRDLDI